MASNGRQNEPIGLKISENKKASLIKGNHSVFLCLNIPSYMGGASDPWHTSKGIFSNNYNNFKFNNKFFFLLKFSR